MNFSGVLSVRALQPEFVFLREKAGEEVEHDKEFECEGHETEETGQRHLEKLQVLADREDINPFRERPHVPEFPQRTADGAGCEQLQSAAEVALLPIVVDAL